MPEIVDTILIFILIGFVAQLVDGALGMAYGVTSTSLLIATGMPPALASATVHAAEIFTSGASGLSHAALRNIDWQVLWRLALAGIVGAICGALLISMFDLHAARPLIAVYLFAMGLILIRKAFLPGRLSVPIGKVRVLGFVGGLIDTAGGGGWGPVVASNMMARGGDPVKTVGTVNGAEFFMTLAATATFFSVLGPVFSEAALGMIIGGVIAAPIAAMGARRVPRKWLLLLVGITICALSVYNILAAAPA